MRFRRSSGLFQIKLSLIEIIRRLSRRSSGSVYCFIDLIVLFLEPRKNCDLSRAFRALAKLAKLLNISIYFLFMINESIWMISVCMLSTVTNGKSLRGSDLQIAESLLGLHDRVRSDRSTAAFQVPVVEFNLKFGRVVRIPPQLISRSSHTYIHADGDNVKITA